MVILPYNLRLSYAIDYVSSLRDFRFISYALLLVLFLCFGAYLTKKKRELRFLFIWYILDFILISGIILFLT